MCGIVGIVTHDNHQTPSAQRLSAMIQSIAHRGPDAQKTWVRPGIGLGHARLSIIDLDTTADQPMHDTSTGNSIVFNGEIYNYIELKEILLGLGHTFTTKSDTEVILKAYAQWGIDCLNQFNGMWAFALYDAHQKTLFCARDRMGVKPFVYGLTPQKDFVFASEAKAIVKHYPEFQQVNHAFLQHFIERDFFACYKETFYNHLYNLLPGHYFVAKPGEEPQQRRYWSWTPSIRKTPLSDEAVQAEFHALLTDAITLRFRSDVPVGACLSGGLDSGTLVGMASALFDKRIHTFSCVYPNHPAFDESHYIKASSDKFNTIATFIEPSHDDLIPLMQASIYEQDGPTGGPSVLSQRAVMELAGRHVKVVLDGQGADEVLGGYHSYFRYHLLSHMRRLKEKKNMRSLREYYATAQAIKERCGESTPRFAAMLAASRNPVGFYTAHRGSTSLDYFQPLDDDLNTLLLEHTFTNLTNLLHYEDRNSMRFSIESRLPFLDYRLIEFAFSLPAHYKIRGSTTKWLLHSVAKNVLPNSVLQRKDKMGFSTPAHEWFLRDENLRYFKRYLNTDNPLYESLPQNTQQYLSNMFTSLTNNAPATTIDVNALWRLFTASMWVNE